ncbi:hypothetical protein GCM10010172_12980 [Paractinoplanes ferrugineus]|uniref:Uncharacterized protein n=1 Tax=Paractinoplanes ferrugineus TaxID=113564 RepID=A0A919IX91_9ACTN|nr:hypothetical protein [Actinoplanes ferrugineus]GIE09863.1 hypothetical protein Afe05nite_17030 [Actinoplanes ferrugineus]
MSDGGLDELFSFRDESVEEVAEPVVKRKSRLWWVVRNALLIAGATVVTIAALRAGGLHISVLLVVAFFIGLRAVLWAVSEVAPPPLPKRRRAARADDGRAFDSLRAAVRRWEKSLDRANTDPDLYTRNVLPVLTELADERLRLRHGITRASDPRRARELLGDPLWAAMHDHGRRSAKTRELETYVEALERL